MMTTREAAEEMGPLTATDGAPGTDLPRGAVMLALEGTSLRLAPAARER